MPWPAWCVLDLRGRRRRGTPHTMTAVAWGQDVGASLQQAFFMFWQTLWPLVLGFGVSGVVQTIRPREASVRSLGTRRPADIVRASGYGMASSSCSPTRPAPWLARCSPRAPTS